MCGACAQQSHHCHVSYEEEDTCVGHVHSRVTLPQGYGTPACPIHGGCTQGFLCTTWRANVLVGLFCVLVGLFRVLPGGRGCTVYYKV